MENFLLEKLNSPNGKKLLILIAEETQRNDSPSHLPVKPIYTEFLIDFLLSHTSKIIRHLGGASNVKEQNKTGKRKKTKKQPNTQQEKRVE